MRFADSDIAEMERLEFAPRKRSKQSLYMAAAFTCVVFIVILSAAAGDSESARGIGATIVSLLLIVLCLISLYVRQRNIDLLLTTEFQNMLYAAAAESGSLFFIISRHNGTVAHASKGLSQLFDYFPYPSHQALDGFFIEGRIPKLDRDKVEEALKSTDPKPLIVQTQTKSGSAKLVLTIEPLKRPAGFCVLRARPFSDTRGNADQLSYIASDTFRHLLDTSPTAHFICDEHGALRYVNPAFAALCGYGAQEMIENHMSIRSLLAQNDRPLGADYEFTTIDDIFQLHSLNGETTPVRLTLNLHRTDNKRVSALVGSLSKVSV